MSTPAVDTKTIEVLLRFYSDHGVDCAMDDVAVNRFLLSAQQNLKTAPPKAAEPASDRPQTTYIPKAADPPRLPPSAEQAVSDAARLAAQAADLDGLKQAMHMFEGCALKLTATQMVFEDGGRDARIMIVGEAPGREEDLAGKPFVGRSGQLLDRMLAAAGFARDQVYLANIIPWRPPGNRTPTPHEIALCLPFITRQIALKKPDILVLLGGPAAQGLLDLREGILKSRGQWRETVIGGHHVRALATLHPAYLLRSPQAKRLVWRDMLALKKAVQDLKT